MRQPPPPPPTVKRYTTEQPPKSRQRWCVSHPSTPAVGLVIIRRHDGSAASSLPACEGCAGRVEAAERQHLARRAVPCQTGRR